MKNNIYNFRFDNINIRGLFQNKISKLSLFIGVVLFYFGTITTLFGQEIIHQEADLNFSYHIIDQGQTQSIYLKWNHLGLDNVVYINDKTVSSSDDGQGLFIPDISLPANLKIVQKDKFGNVFNESEAVLKQREKGIVDVSTEMSDKLNEWQDSQQTVFDFFNQTSDIPDEELIAFYQSFLDISPERMSSLLKNQTSQKLSKRLFSNAYYEEDKLRNPDVVINCNCKVVRTNTSILVSSNGSDTWGYKKPFWNKPEREQQNGSFPLGHSYLYLWDSGTMGEAKYGKFYMATDNSSSDIVKTKNFNTTLLNPRMTFRMNCYDPSTISLNSDACLCDKTITLEYQYTSHIELFADKHFTVSGSRKSEITVEDYVFLIKTAQGGDSLILDSGITSISSGCNSGDLSNFISTPSEVANNIEDILNRRSTLVKDIRNTTDVRAVFKNINKKSIECDRLEHVGNIISGRLSFTFSSKDKTLEIHLKSGAKVQGIVKGSSEVSAKLNSSYYLTAILETGDSPDYCCPEKMAVYDFGSMSDQIVPSTGEAITMSQGLIPNMEDLQSDLGLIIGRFFPWGDAFEKDDCCDDDSVIIPNHYNCVFYQEDCNNDVSAVENMISDPLNTRLEPNPAYSGGPLTLRFQPSIQSIYISDIQGKTLYSITDLPKEIDSYRIDRLHLLAGTYVVRFVYPDNAIAKKLVVQ